MKILVLIAGLCFIFTYIKYDTSDCDSCSFNLNGKEVGIDKFMNKYFGECVNKIANSPFIDP